MPAADGWRLPLADIRVVDCTAWWAGPVATAALAGLGADVIKVESVTRPDNMRFASTRPPTHDRWWEWSPIFHAANAGKRGVTFDLSRPEGSEMFERLLQTADVLVENFTPRVMEQFGFGWDRVHSLNDQLDHGADAGLRSRRAVAGPDRLRPDHGVPDRHVLVDGVRRGAPGVGAGGLRPLGRDACGHCHHARPDGARPTWRGHAWSRRPWSSPCSMPQRNRWSSTARAGRCSVVTGTGVRRPPPKGSTPVPAKTEWVAIAVASDDQWRSLRSLAG